MLPETLFFNEIDPEVTRAIFIAEASRPRSSSDCCHPYIQKGSVDRT